MKIRFTLLICLTLSNALPVFAAKGGKASAKSAEKALPSVQLHRLIETTLPKINHLGPKNAVSNRTTLIEAQVNYVAKAQTAPPAEQPMYRAAAGVMNTLILAVDEHDKAVANFHYSKGVHGPQDTKDSEVTNAVGNGRANNAKQNKENADSRKELLAKEAFMSKGAIDSWTVRAAQLRAGVEQAYAAELMAEKQTVVAAVPPPPPATKTPPKPKPAKKESSAADQYSPAGSWASDGPPWVFNEDGTFTNGHGGGGEWKWKNQSNGELELKWRAGAVRKGTFSANGHSLEVEKQGGQPITLKR